MRCALVGLLLCSACAFSGCGVGGAPQALPSAQHGGEIMALPGGKGFAELLIDRGQPAKGATGKLAKAAPTRLLAYFYQSDGSTALSPAPSDVKVHLGAADQGKDVTLAPQSAPAGQFASEPGEFPTELRGELNLTLGGEPVRAPFMFR
jgi:hypothetical protein